MKRMLSAMLSLCLLIALLPAVAVPAQAASAPIENCLQFVSYYNQSTDEFDEYSYPCVLLNMNGYNFVFTHLAPKDGLITAVCVAGEDSWFGTDYVQEWNGALHAYVTDDAFEAKNGFLPVGAVTKNEKIRYVGYNSDWKPVVVETVAVDYKQGQVIPKDPIETGVTVAVVNSKNEICAIEYAGICMTLATNEEIFFGSSGSQETEPPATEPPATEPPATEPPATEPPATEPPATEPPATEPQNGGLTQEERRPVDLQDLDKIYSEAINQKKPNQSGTIATAVIAVLIIGLAAAVVIVRRRNKMKVNQDLDEAEEGTELADVPVDTGLRLQFRGGKRIAVKRSFTIGRAPDNDVVIPKTSTAVSGHHCEIVVQNGAAYLRDLGSTNGTFINGRRLATGQLVQLLPGMNVSLGGAGSPEVFVVGLSSKQM